MYSIPFRSFWLDCSFGLYFLSMIRDSTSVNINLFASYFTKFESMNQTNNKTKVKQTDRTRTEKIKGK